MLWFFYTEVTGLNVSMIPRSVQTSCIYHSTTEGCQSFEDPSKTHIAHFDQREPSASSGLVLVLGHNWFLLRTGLL